MVDTLRQAQNIIYDAWESDGKRRYMLAKKALSISKDCADAYLILAEKAKTPKEEVAQYKKAMEAGERALGKKGFEEYAGAFWGFHETRPYMRAREQYAHGLWYMNKKKEAKRHFQEMLHLNPSDNQGIRYSLINLLIELNAFEDAHSLYKQYENDGSAWWRYSNILLSFVNKLDEFELKQLLAKAVDHNPFVVPLLLELTPFPEYLPGYYGIGDENEAVSYAYDAIKAWKAVNNSIDWLSKAYKPLPM